MAWKVKMQPVAGTWIRHVILDLVAGDWLIAQITPLSLPVPGIDGGREHDWQSALLDAPQGKGA
jgi:hypothetical protein